MCYRLKLSSMSAATVTKRFYFSETIRLQDLLQRSPHLLPVDMPGLRFLDKSLQFWKVLHFLLLEMSMFRGSFGDFLADA